MTVDKLISLFFFILNGFLFFFNSVNCQGPIVNTKLGQIRGVVADDGDYTNFLGIPFAKVKEENPFGEALPYPAFDGIFEANDDSAICPQEEEFNNTIVGTLDCLHLNIHVPNSATPTNRLPVFVWIYGGGFQFGFYGRFLYGPKFLVRHDIIFISINYRVGPYGFMCLDIPEVPGNQGLKDQILALRWIHDNIAYFGGDSDKITIAGNSAGGIAVEHHLLRKSDEPKLFHQAILQSGSVHIPGMSASSSPDNKIPLLMAQHLGFETTDMHEAIAFLAKIDPLAIVQTGLDLDLMLMTCTENSFEGVEPFITEDQVSISDVPAANDMPIMIGFNNDEMGSLIETGVGNAGLVTFYFFLATVLNPLHPDFISTSQNVQHFYFGDDEINDDQIRELADYAGDLMFVHPMFRALRRLIENGGNMYLYKFSYDGGRNFVKHRENYTAGGASHADELGYLFDISYMEEPNPEDQRVIDSMTAMWANFVKYTNPTLLPHKWEAISKGSSYHYMDIDLELTVGTRPLQERMTYLDLLHHSLGDNQRAVWKPNSEIYHIMKKAKLFR